MNTLRTISVIEVGEGGLSGYGDPLEVLPALERDVCRALQIPKDCPDGVRVAVRVGAERVAEWVAKPTVRRLIDSVSNLVKGAVRSIERTESVRAG